MYSTRRVWGILIIFVGVMALLQQIPYIGYLNFSTLLFGAAFLGLYYTKKKDWALWIGIPLTILGTVDVFKVLRFPLGDGVLLMLLGIGLFYGYYRKKSLGLLVPASILIWLGTYEVLEDIAWLNRFEGSLFFLCMSACILTIYILAEPRISEKWYTTALWIAGFAAFIAVFEYDQFFYLLSPYMNFIFPIILIGIGGIIILKGWKKD